MVNADTFASEIGVIDRNVYMITNFKRTVPGVNGGVSLTGEMAALGGSLIVGIATSSWFQAGQTQLTLRLLS